jgi:hypothetical protein
MFIRVVALVATANAFSDQIIDESVRFNNDQEGIIVSVGEHAINYLKTQYLPYLYEKVEKIELPEFDFKEGPFSGKVKPTISLPEPE